MLLSTFIASESTLEFSNAVLISLLFLFIYHLVSLKINFSIIYTPHESLKIIGKRNIIFASNCIQSKFQGKKFLECSQYWN